MPMTMKLDVINNAKPRPYSNPSIKSPVANPKHMVNNAITIPIIPVYVKIPIPITYYIL